MKGGDEYWLTLKRRCQEEGRTDIWNESNIELRMWNQVKLWSSQLQIPYFKIIFQSYGCESLKKDNNIMMWT